MNSCRRKRKRKRVREREREKERVLFLQFAQRVNNQEAKTPREQFLLFLPNNAIRNGKLELLLYPRGRKD